MPSHVPFESLPGSNGQPTATVRHGDTIRRPAGPWTPAVHALLRHLEGVGFPASPRVVGDGYDDQGREVLTYIEGRIAHPHPYTDEGIWQVGRLLRALHDGTAGFRPPAGARWRPWSLRSRAPGAVVSHCDAGPLARHRARRPAGRVDRLVDGRPDRPPGGGGRHRLVERAARLRRSDDSGSRRRTPAPGRDRSG